MEGGERGGVANNEVLDFGGFEVQLPIFIPTVADVEEAMVNVKAVTGY